MDFAVLGDGLEQRVLIDLAVDGDGEAILKMGAELGKFLGQSRKQLAHRRCGDIKLRYAAGVLPEIADQNDVGHAPCLISSR